MAQVQSGIRSALALPWVYRLWRGLMLPEKDRARIVSECLRPLAGSRILDIGCGPAHVLRHLPECDYLGVDVSAEYIAAARQRYDRRGRFLRASIMEMELEGEAPFDLALCLGVLHHLSDEEGRMLFQKAAQMLQPQGRIVTIDPVLCKGQNPLARWLIQRDRGQNVRDLEGYCALAAPFFEEVQTEARHNLTRLPYTHGVLEACRPTKESR